MACVGLGAGGQGAGVVGAFDLGLGGGVGAVRCWGDGWVAFVVWEGGLVRIGVGRGGLRRADVEGLAVGDGVAAV